MAILCEWPGCKRRCSAKAKVCKCGFALVKYSGKTYWIAYYDLNKKQVRRRIGPSRAAAEQELRQVLTAKAEGRSIKRSVDAQTTFREIAVWYLDLPEVRAKRSYNRDCVTMRQLVSYFGDKLLANINMGMVEAYRQKRLAEPSGRTPKTLVKPASVNREVSCLRSVFNRAMRNDKAEKNPVAGLKILKENNARDRVLAQDEYERLLGYCPDHLKPIVRLAYHTGMRKGEILELTWGQVEPKGFIKLTPEDTKTEEPRLVPLNPEMVEMLRGMRVVLGGMPLPGVKVFVYQGRPMGLIRKSLLTACKQAGIEDFTFHDLRHTFNTNAYRAGVPIPSIMRITGHKSYSMFMRYTTITPEDLRTAIAKM